MKNQIIQEAVTNDELNQLYDNLIQKSYKLYQGNQNQDNYTINSSSQLEFEKDNIVSIDQLKTDELIQNNIQIGANLVVNKNELKLLKQDKNKIYSYGRWNCFFLFTM
ncbi:Hypothetical_protein [Hexamita inflata]|uniref:Hypothetical_protein n=1 Tax=Hexamita inflata TaxID=28002 RepID=A0AA86NB21_9EUKA|nr:Hypothetical protein HINF_LOCUS3775 [Hexamita inflata]